MPRGDGIITHQSVDDVITHQPVSVRWRRHCSDITACRVTAQWRHCMPRVHSDVTACRGCIVTSLHAEGFEVLPQLLLVRLAEVLGGERAAGHAGGRVNAVLRAPGERVGDGSQNSRI